ncbi:MAG: Gldg family protein [Planctomycetota bacterium]
MPLNNIALALATLIAYDLVLLLILLGFVLVLSKTKQAAYAVMRRNFVGYFSNPTGYVFLCIFVFLTSVAAFWPDRFFAQNLATLDELNYWFPLIMLVFIPAITMSIWAEEKRQGTDELLLTLPADDFDIVIGKYSAAAAIFTASLLFSQLATFMTLAVLTEGELDVGLIFTSYLGYYLVGLTMIAIGMVASFLTSNLTVGFVLGALFNAPLAFASLIQGISPSQRIAQIIGESGIARPFDDLGRGVISSSSIVYFVLVAVIGLYLCMVLIGRRHWTGGKDGNTMAWHYLARVLALVVIAAGAVVLFRTKDVVRQDLTEGKVSSLSPATESLIRDLNTDKKVVIDAYISKDIPETYAKTRYELVTLLKEFRSEAASGGREIEVNLYEDIELSSEEAKLAEERFGIEPVERLVREKGTPTRKKFILGAAFKSGLQNVTVPIFEYGVPVEYELVRSIDTVASGTKKRLGIVASDARLMGGMVMNGMQMQQVPQHPLIEELGKQYEVEEVDLSSPISSGVYAALVCVQPSSLSPEQFTRLLEAIQEGVPTAIFEDPAPLGASYITPTGQPKQAPGGMFGGGGGQQPKGNIRELWDLLELDVPHDLTPQGGFDPKVVWQAFNPYPALEDSANPLWMFIDDQAPGFSEGDGEEAAARGFEPLTSDNPITSGMNEVLLIVGSGVRAREDAMLTHTTLLRTGNPSGLLANAETTSIMRGETTLDRVVEEIRGFQSVAMAIEGTVDSPESNDDGESEDGGEESKESEEKPVRAVYVGDTDLMLPEFLMLRADPDSIPEVRFQFQNVTFVLNVIDWLTGQYDFIEVRKHEPSFTSLVMIDSVRKDAQQVVSDSSKQFEEDFEIAKREAEEEVQKAVAGLQEDIEKMQDGTRSVSRSQLQAKMQQFEREQSLANRKLNVKLAKLERERDTKIRDAQRVADDTVTKLQNQVKAYAVVLPCIPPLVVGVVVFAARRLRERESIAKSRLK